MFRKKYLPNHFALKILVVAVVCLWGRNLWGLGSLVIELYVKNPDSGFKISGGRIPAGCNSVRMTLTASNTKTRGPVALELEGRANIGGKTIVHPAGPADDMMQAFLYRHLVPAQEFFVYMQKAKWQMPPMERVGSGPVQIPAGRSVQVHLKTAPGPFLKEIDLELYEPPAGITLHNVTVVPEGLAFVLKADQEVVKNAVSSNLIIQLFREYAPQPQDRKLASNKRRDSIGILPAIPIQIILKPPKDEFPKKT